MSVMMGMVVEADPARFEQVAKDNAEQAGAISHQFLAGKDSILVVDEWPDEASFLGFFEASGEEIGSLMSQSGVTTKPTPNFWRPLDTPDKF